MRATAVVPPSALMMRDDSVSIGGQSAIFADRLQAEICDNGSCDIRRHAVHKRMDIAEIRERMKARGLGIRELAARIPMDENKLSKSLGPTRRKFTVEEMDGLRRTLVDGMISIPSEDDLAAMLATAHAELPLGISFGDYPIAVAASLRAQLLRYSGARVDDAEKGEESLKAPKGASQSRAPTKRSARRYSRIP